MFRESSSPTKERSVSDSERYKTQPLKPELWTLKKDFAVDQSMGPEEKRSLAQGIYFDLTNRYSKFKGVNRNLSESQRIEEFIKDPEASTRLREVVEKGLANFVTSQEADEKAPKASYAQILKADIDEINQLAVIWLSHHKEEYK